jgi:hypothetical protein
VVARRRPDFTTAYNGGCVVIVNRSCAFRTDVWSRSHRRASQALVQGEDCLASLVRARQYGRCSYLQSRGSDRALPPLGSVALYAQPGHKAGASRL